MNNKFTSGTPIRYVLALAIAFIPFAQNAFGQVLHINENFSSASGTTPPSGWSQNKIAGSATSDNWNFNNQGGRTITSPLTSPVATFDSDNMATFVNENVALESPTVNTTGYTTVKLKWDQFFAGIYNTGFDGIYAEVYNGTSWNTVYSNTTLAYPGAASSQDIDVSTYAANRTGVRVRFRFVGNYSWWWIIDNIQLYTPVVDVQATLVGLTSNSVCGNVSDNVVVTIKNNGPAALTNIPVVCKVSGAATATLNTTLTRSLAAAGGTDTVIFPTGYNTLPGGVYTFKAYTDLASDLVRSNDTVNSASTVIGTPNTPTLSPVTQCGTGSANLSAGVSSASDSVYWYGSSSPTAALLGSGLNFTTPVISTTTTYWAESRRGSPRDTITTTYAAGNGQNGAMFDFTPAKTLRLDSFLFVSQTSGSYAVSLYYRTGTYVGNELNAAAWTLVGTKTVTLTTGNNIVTIGGIYLNAAQVYGMYVTFGGTLSYTNGTNTYTSPAGTINAGVGISGTFGGVFTPRTWNGTLYLGGGCASTRVSTTVTVNPKPANVSIIQGSPFQGNYLGGTYVQPDNTKSGNTVTYEVTPPTGFANSTYGTGWTVTNATIKTPSGTSLGTVNFTAPTSSVNGKITGTAAAANIDSTFIVNYTVKLLGNNCDTTITRILYEAPVPQANFTSTVSCFGKPTQFTDSTKLLRGTISYSWDFGDAGFADTSHLQNPSYSFSAAGTYNVRLIATSDLGYSDTITKTVSVGYIPVTNFTGVNKCEGDSLVFTNTTTLGGTPLPMTYSWSWGDNSANSTATNAKHLYSSIGTYNVTLTATTSTGCSASMTKPATQFAQPKASFTTSDVCSGTKATFNNTSTIANGSIGQDWMFGDNTTSTDVSPDHTYDNAGTYTVKVIVYSGFGCKDSVSKPIVIKPLPVPDFSYTGSCSNEDYTFSNSTTFGSTFTSEWDFGTGYATNNSGTFTKQFTAGTYTVKLRATGNGCAAVKTTTVQVNAAPVAAFNITGNVCKNTDMDLTNNTSGADNYLWTFGDNSNSIVEDPAKSYSTPGNYTIWLRALSSNGCVDSTSNSITVYDLPSPGFTWAKIGDTINDRQVQFTPNSLTYNTYEWTFGDGSTSNQVNPVYSYLSNGPFQAKLKVSNNNGCYNTTNNTAVLFNVSAGNVVAGAFSFNVYPNPFRGEATISYDLVKAGQVEVKVYDLSGKELGVLVNANQQIGSYKVPFNTAKFGNASGMYMIRFSLDGQIGSKQVFETR